MKNKIKYFLIISLLTFVVLFFIFSNKKQKVNSIYPIKISMDDCVSTLNLHRWDLQVFRPGNLNKDSLIDEIKIKMDPVIPISKEKYNELMIDSDFRILSDSTYNIYQEKLPYFKEVNDGFCMYRNFLKSNENSSCDVYDSWPASDRNGGPNQESWCEWCLDYEKNNFQNFNPNGAAWANPDVICDCCSNNQFLNQETTNLVVYLDSDIFLLQQPDFKPPFFPVDFSINPQDTSQWLTIGLHWFLGEGHPFYQTIPDYLRCRYDSIYMSPMIFHSVGSQYIRFNQIDNINDETLLGAMISTAKPYFFAKNMLPDVPEYRIFGFTKFTDLDGNVYDEMDFAVANESYFWKDILLKNDLLYSTARDLKELYIIPGPNIDCPSRLGTWLGLRILESYYTNNTDLNLQDILLESDYKKILNQSNYQP